MGRPRVPLAAQKGRISGKVREEMAAQEASVACPRLDVEPPPFLNANERRRFEKTADLLRSVGEQMCTELDVDQLATYCVEYETYIETSKKLKKAMRSGADPKSISAYQQLQTAAFNKAQTCRNALGLNVASRLKLDLRETKKKDDNPFDRFSDGQGN